MYNKFFSKKKREWKTVGDTPEEWKAKHELVYCQLWDSTFRKNVCQERKRIAIDDNNRFSSGDGVNFSTFHRCVECKGPLDKKPEPVISVEEIKMEEIVKEVKKKAEVGDPCVCQKCGSDFEAYQRGRMVCSKTCLDCVMKAINSKRNSVVETKQVTSEDTYISGHGSNSPEGLIVFPDKIDTEIIEQKTEAPDLDREYPNYIYDLFNKEEDLLVRVMTEATRQRRTVTQQILWMIEKSSVWSA